MTRREILDAVKALPVAEVLSRAGKELKRNGRGWECPVCEDRRQTRILTVNTSRWDCGHCGAKGSSADMWLRIQGLDPERLADEHYECLARLLGTSAPSRVEDIKIDPPGLSPKDVRWYWERMNTHRVVDQWTWMRNLRKVRAWPRHRPPPENAPTKTLSRVIKSSPCAVFPLFTTAPERCGQLFNLIIRPLKPYAVRKRDASAKQEYIKSLPLNWGSGSCADGRYPLCYGDPNGATKAPVLVLVEGFCDQAFASTLANDQTRVLGARCASDLRESWFCVLQGYKGKLWLLPHLDTPTERYPRGVGVEAMVELQRQLLAVGVDAHIWPWGWVLRELGMTVEQFRQAGGSDLNDLVRADRGMPMVEARKLARVWRGVVG